MTPPRRWLARTTKPSAPCVVRRKARQTGRTNKTLAGTRRQTILTSVLESLRLYLTTFTLASVIEEMNHWWTAGRRCFEELLQKLKLALPEPSTLDRLLPRPSG
jgi:transposase